MSTIDLPLPPSVNRLWRSNRGRVHRAPRYLSWLKAAGWELVTQRPERLAGSVRVNISAGRPDRRRRDVDNLGKALLDLLTKHEVIQDDSCVVSITCGWDDDVAAACTSKCGVAGLRRNARVRVRMGSDIVRSLCRKP